MELREIGEFDLIARIRSRLPTFSPDVFKGIGDDAAIASLSTGTDLVSTVDLLVEDVHFDLTLTSARHLGRKPLAANLSDIAPMGATPRFALISLALPTRLSVEFTDDQPFAGQVASHVGALGREGSFFCSLGTSRKVPGRST